MPLPLQRGHVIRAVLSARVFGALGFAHRGNSFFTLPVPLQSGHFDTTDIPIVYSP